jgi:hypothetical protein
VDDTQVESTPSGGRKPRRGRRLTDGLRAVTRLVGSLAILMDAVAQLVRAIGRF